jgi:hypothetical protein
MNEPTRLIDDKSTLPLELELLRSATLDEVHPARRARLLTGLGVVSVAAPLAVGAAVASSGATSTSTATVVASSAQVNGALAGAEVGNGAVASGFITKLVGFKAWLGAALVATAAGVGVYTFSASQAKSEAPQSPAVAVTLEPAMEVTPTPAEVPVLTAEERLPTEAASTDVREANAGAKAAARKESGDKSSLSRELSLVDSARQALLRGDPKLTLSRLDAYRTQFPKGALRSEAAMLRVEALVAVGDRAGAKRVGQQLLRGAPNSPYSQRIRSLLGNAESSTVKAP